MTKEKMSGKTSAWAKCWRVAMDPSMTNVEVAKQTGVSRQIVAKVKKIILYTKGNPKHQLIKDLNSGLTSIDEALEEIERLKKQAEDSKRYRARKQGSWEQIHEDATDLFEKLAEKIRAATPGVEESEIRHLVSKATFALAKKGKSDDEIKADKRLRTLLASDVIVSDLMDFVLAAIAERGVPEETLCELLEQEEIGGEIEDAEAAKDDLSTILSTHPYLRERLLKHIYDSFGGREKTEYFILDFAQCLLKRYVEEDRLDLSRYGSTAELVRAALGDPEFQEELRKAMEGRELFRSASGQGDEIVDGIGEALQF